VEEVSVQLEVPVVVVDESVTLVQDTVNPVEGVMELVNEIVSANPPDPVTMIVSVPVWPAVKVTEFDDSAREKSAGWFTVNVSHALVTPLLLASPL
jgi:hypothetical protein